MMSGPRIQLSVVDGFENGGHSTLSSQVLDFGVNLSAAETNRRPFSADAYILDYYDGRQGLSHIYWQPGSVDNPAVGCKIRYALKTTTPGTYLIVSVYYGDNNYAYGFVYNYTKVGNYPLSTTGFPNLTVEFNTNEWVRYGAPQNDPLTVNRATTNIYCGNVDFKEWIQNANANYDGFSYTGASTGIYTSSTLSGNILTSKIESTAPYYSIRIIDSSRSITPLIPIDMAGRKFGGPADRVIINPASRGVVYKVYSRAKGCMCLKSFLNGEIPILNE